MHLALILQNHKKVFGPPAQDEVQCLASTESE